MSTTIAPENIGEVLRAATYLQFQVRQALSVELMKLGLVDHRIEITENGFLINVSGFSTFMDPMETLRRSYPPRPEGGIE